MYLFLELGFIYCKAPLSSRKWRYINSSFKVMYIYLFDLVAMEKIYQTLETYFKNSMNFVKNNPQPVVFSTPFSGLVSTKQGN